ncbi:preprotein translocase subunit SecE [Candidatus Uhrbacteria bacterium]|nr:preprotein translocase subunit SecE [Candidatus Uhrbacteria bacterium]
MAAISNAKNRLGNYVKDSYFEMKKVVWPSRKQAIHHTLMVIVFSAVVAIFLGALDMLFSYVIQRILTPQ